MRIGFDAKRAFLNKSGLGSYSRNLITALSSNFPGSEFYLYTTKSNPELFSPSYTNVSVRTPHNVVYHNLPSLWRSCGVSKMLKSDGIDVFHGLSHEIPYRFPVKKIRSVVTIHDLIFLRLPHLYNTFDRIIYKQKVSYACQVADRIIAISRQTADDIIEYFGVDPDRIEVIYQGCHPGFYNTLSQDDKNALRVKYNLPELFILYVGTIEERKNLMAILRALQYGNINIPLVVVGKKTPYAKEVMKYLDQHRSIKVVFYDVVDNIDLRGFYQLAGVFVYPSVYEGFGIPVLEALASGTPVITSKGGCFAEAGGPASLYVDPVDIREIAEAIQRVIKNPGLREQMVETGYQHASKFKAESVAGKIMQVYEKLMQNDR
ncbi:MAG: glycosyltransferase family 4 protein [Bacteroidales bacterium]|nr:glycosyltransferase family 4 protein [Bacteroidales bacterium]MBN2761954.1 glycosyltransferase family 4 protein [Bacteroidales bacterium]